MQDWLIVSLGDSYGSGDGVPHMKIDQTQHEEFDAACAQLEAKAAALTKVDTDLAPLQDAFADGKRYDDDIKAHCAGS